MCHVCVNVKCISTQSNKKKQINHPNQYSNPCSLATIDLFRFQQTFSVSAMEEHDGGGGYTGGRRSLRYEFSREPNGSTASVTLGGILSIKETTTSSSSPSYRIHNRTLLDLIRTDPTTNDSKKPWKMFRDKLRLKLSGSVCTTTVPILASLVHINTVTDNNRTTTENATIQLNSPLVSNVNSNGNGNGNSSSVAVTQPGNNTNMLNLEPVSNDNGNGNSSSVSDTQTENVRSEPTVKVSLMRLLEVDGSACFEDDDDGDDVVVGGGDGGDGGGGYNNCCVCMVRHKGAAFIPCGHTFCRLCSRELFVKRANCPLCNNFISEILDIF